VFLTGDHPKNVYLKWRRAQTVKSEGTKRWQSVA